MTMTTHAIEVEAEHPELGTCWGAIEVYVHGEYRPATRIEPEEWPEVDCDDLIHVTSHCDAKGDRPIDARISWECLTEEQLQDAFNEALELHAEATEPDPDMVRDLRQDR